MSSPAVQLPRILTPALAAAVGVSRSEVRTALRRGHWRTLAAGLVLTRPEPPGRTDWAEAGLALAGRTGALSGWDALRLRGIGDRRPPDAPVLVLTREGRSRRVGEVLVRRTDRPYLSAVTSWAEPALPNALIAATPRAVADHALTLRSLAAVRAVVAQAADRGCSLSTLVDELDAGPRQGSAHLRRAVAEIGEGARSAAEADAVTRLRSARVPPFELNVPVLDGAGRVVYVVDILWRALRAALEIDSREHHYALDDWEATLRRHNALTRYGLVVMHRPPTEIRAPGRAWLTETEAWLRVRARELGIAPSFGGGVTLGGGPYVLADLAADLTVPR